MEVASNRSVFLPGKRIDYDWRSRPKVVRARSASRAPLSACSRNLTEHVTRLSPGDSLVLYTDGVVEARSPDGSFFGEERLASLLRSCISLDAQTLADRVESAVLDFQENGPRDAIAVLVLRMPE